MKEVLVVDDSRAMRSILKRIFSGHGFHVHEAANGMEALTRLQAEATGVAMMCADCNMPVMNGIDLVRSVRKIERFRALPILMITTETGISAIEKALESGVNEYLMKPFTSEMVVDKLQTLGLDVN